MAPRRSRAQGGASQATPTPEPVRASPRAPAPPRRRSIPPTRRPNRAAGALIVALLAGLLVGLALSGGAAAAPAKDGLVAAYGFNEADSKGMRFGDASGLKNGAVGRDVRRVKGRFGRGVRFNGRSSWLTVPPSSSLNLAPGMTLEAWVKPRAASGRRAVITKQGARPRRLRAARRDPAGGRGPGGHPAQGAQGRAGRDGAPGQVDPPGGDLRPRTPAPVRQRHRGRLGAVRRAPPALRGPAADRRERGRRRLVQGGHRRGAHLPARPQPEGDPPRHAPPRGAAARDRAGAAPAGAGDRARPVLLRHRLDPRGGAHRRRPPRSARGSRASTSRSARRPRACASSSTAPPARASR